MLRDVLNTRIQQPDTSYELIDRRGKKPHNSQREFEKKKKRALSAKKTVVIEENRFKPLTGNNHKL